MIPIFFGPQALSHLGSGDSKKQNKKNSQFYEYVFNANFQIKCITKELDLLKVKRVEYIQIY
jgi:hypothetical protein